MSDRYRVARWNEGRPPAEEELRRRMVAEGYSVYSWTDGAGAAYGQHEHGEDQSHWVVSGSMELDVEGFGRVILSPGDRDFMPAGTSHSARVVGDRPASYLIGAR